VIGRRVWFVFGITGNNVHVGRKEGDQEGRLEMISGKMIDNLFL
jgi:hypothetical protein